MNKDTDIGKWFLRDAELSRDTCGDKEPVVHLTIDLPYAFTGGFWHNFPYLCRVTLTDVDDLFMPLLLRDILARPSISRLELFYKREQRLDAQNVFEPFQTLFMSGLESLVIDCEFAEVPDSWRADDLHRAIRAAKNLRDVTLRFEEWYHSLPVAVEGSNGYQITSMEMKGSTDKMLDVRKVCRTRLPPLFANLQYLVWTLNYLDFPCPDFDFCALLMDECISSPHLLSVRSSVLDRADREPIWRVTPPNESGFSIPKYVETGRPVTFHPISMWAYGTRRRLMHKTILRNRCKMRMLIAYGVLYPWAEQTYPRFAGSMRTIAASLILPFLGLKTPPRVVVIS